MQADETFRLRVQRIGLTDLRFEPLLGLIPDERHTCRNVTCHGGRLGAPGLTSTLSLSP
jgi:hypothetical protein